MRLRTTAREVVAERRALDRLSPVAQLASARERVGLLARSGDARDLGRARRTAAPRGAARGRGSVRPCPAGWRATARGSGAATCSTVWRSGAWRSPGRRSAAAAAALAVLGPQATLDRGYAIVRRADDGRIVRDPADAPPGTRLAFRVARGELPATADER